MTDNTPQPVAVTALPPYLQRLVAEAQAQPHDPALVLVMRVGHSSWCPAGDAAGGGWAQCVCEPTIEIRFEATPQ